MNFKNLIINLLNVNSFSIVLTAVLIILLTQTSFAQGPPAPPAPPVGLVPWGNPFVYLAILFGYSYFKMKKINQK